MALGAITWVVGSARRYKAIQIPSFQLSQLNSIHAFNELSHDSAKHAADLTSRFDSIKQRAFNKISDSVKTRNTFNTLSNLTSIFSIVASFLLSVIGANRGIVVDNNNLSQSLSVLKKKELGFKKALLLLSALAILFTTLSNKFGSYATTAQSQANDMAGVLKTAEMKMLSALNAKEIDAIIDNLEIDVSKY